MMAEHHLSFLLIPRYQFGYSNGLYLISKGSIYSHILLMPIACDAVLIQEVIIVSFISLKIDIIMFQTQIPY